jgi:hypothetical protein
MWAALIAYGAVISTWVGAVAGGSDTSGYFNEAKLFSHFRIHAQARMLPGLPAPAARPYLYVPLGFKPAGDGALAPTYPAGLSLMLVPFASVVGWENAGDVLLVLHALAGVALVYRLGRLSGLARPWASAGAAVLAVSPLYIFMSQWAMSDVPAMVWATAAVTAAWKSEKRPSWAIAAGICAAVGFLIRPSNFLVAIPMLVLIGASPRRLLYAALAGIPGVIAWAMMNHAAYGGYLLSGYGAIGNEFHLALVPETFRYCLRWLPLILTPLVLISPGIVAFLASRTRAALALATWALAYILFYLPYRWTHEDWWFLRFLLPAAPALIVSGLLVLQGIYHYLKGRVPDPFRPALFVLLIVSCLSVSLTEIKPLSALLIGRGERKYGLIAAWLKVHVPDNSVIVASQFSGAAYYYTSYVVMRPEELAAGAASQAQAAVLAQRRPIFSVTFPFEQDGMKALPGKWVLFGTVKDVTVWRGDWGIPAK